jgi:hypothetical protein
MMLRRFRILETNLKISKLKPSHHTSQNIGRYWLLNEDYFITRRQEGKEKKGMEEGDMKQQRGSV